MWYGPDGLCVLVSHDKQPCGRWCLRTGLCNIVSSADAVVWGAGGAPVVAVHRVDADDVGVLEEDVGAGRVEVEVVVLRTKEVEW